MFETNKQFRFFFIISKNQFNFTLCLHDKCNYLISLDFYNVAFE